MAAPRTPPDKWVEAGLQALAKGGPEAVRIEALAQSLGVTKGGFYWHFDDRPALLEALLDAWEKRSIDEPLAVVDEAGGDARESLRLLASLAAKATRETGLLEIDLAVRDWARHDRSVAARLRRVDNQRMEYMRGQISQFCSDPDEVEVRCLLVLSLWIGSHFIAADHDGRSRAEVVELAVKRLLE